MKLLLDTHAFIWWDDDYARLPAPLMDKLLDPENTIYLSLVSIWEMQIKVQLGKLRLAVSLEQRVQAQRESNQLQILSIAQEHIYALGDLPDHHRDPFDRLLIAQARIEDLPLVTHDQYIRQYEVATIWDQ